MTRSIRDRDLARSHARICGMRARRLLGLATVCYLALAGAGRTAGCSPISCAPSQVPLSHGRLLAVRPDGTFGIVRVVDLRTGATRWRLPGGVLSGHLVVHQDATLLTWFDVATGARVGDGVLQLRGSFALVGSSQDGSRAVLVRSQTKRTTFAIVSPHGERVVVLGGNNWNFDALNGNLLYVLQYLQNGYQVRLYDLAANRLRPAPLKDAHESALIDGVPWLRLSTPDGRYLFTLYLTQSGSAMVHELDTVAATARCIDLPGSSDFNRASSYTLTLSPDARTLYAVSSGDGKVVSIDVAAARVSSTFGFAASLPASPVGGAAAISPNGKRVAVSLAGELFVVDLAHHRVARRSRGAIALGFAPDNRTLWVVGQKSRLTALRLAA